MDGHEVDQNLDPDIGYDPVEGEEGDGVLDSKFGGDAAALAAAYTELEGKLGSQGEELGMLRTLIEKLPAAAGNGETDGGEATKSARDQFMEKLSSMREGGGEVDLYDLMGDMFSAVDASMGERLKPVEQSAVLGRLDSLWDGFFTDNPQAKPLQGAMQELFKQRPNLIPTDGGREAFMEGMRDLQDLATLRSRRKPATMSSGGSRLLGRQGTGRAGSQKQLNEAFKHAQNTGNVRDWAEVVKIVRARSDQAARI